MSKLLLSFGERRPFRESKNQMFKTELNKKQIGSMADPQQSPALAYTSVSHVCGSVKKNP